MRNAALLLLFLAPTLVNAGIPAGYSLLYDQNFEEPAAVRDFIFSDATAWKISRANNNAALELVKQSNYKPVVRSPVNISLINGKQFTDFVLEGDFIQTGREYGHRDMCIYFGFQNTTNFYYVHIATAADPHAHNIFAVTNAPRIAIATETTKGVNWGLDIWHKVRLERNTGNGDIRVFFDDMSKPIMVAQDKTFGAGYAGFGSFDDTGMVDNIKIWGTEAKSKPAAFFGKAR